MPEEIVLEFSPEGDVTIEGKGFEGPDCQRLTKELEQDLGVKAHTKLKPEYHRARTVGRKAGA